MEREMPYTPKPEVEKICSFCGKPFKTRISTAGYCNPICRKSGERGKYRTLNPVSGLSHGTVGAIAELRVSTDLLQKGYEVFRALSPSCSCDLAILKNGILYRVEVRTGYKNLSGNLYYSRGDRDIGRQDIFAVLHDDMIYYFPELPS